MDHRIRQRPSLSNLPFQISLYYGSLYSIIFAILIGAGAVSKVNCFKIITQITIKIMIYTFDYSINIMKSKWQYQL